MQRGLPIKEDDVAVIEMTIDDVTEMEHDLLRVHMLERDHAAVGAHDGLGAGKLVGAILHEPVHLVAIVGRDLLGEGEVHRDFQGDTDLGDREVRVGRDDGAGRELYALALDVVADAALLRAEALLHGLERAARALGGGRHAGDLVVHEGGHVVLEHGVLVLDHGLRRAVIDLLLESVVRHDDLE